MTFDTFLTNIYLLERMAIDGKITAIAAANRIIRLRKKCPEAEQLTIKIEANKSL